MVEKIIKSREVGGGAGDIILLVKLCLIIAEV
jgi:hypothetical protein